MIRKSPRFRTQLFTVTTGLALLYGFFASRPLHSQQPTAAAVVAIDNFSFTPATITVSPGTTVTWTNRDDIPHTVVSSDDPKAFKSKVLDTGDTFSYTFTKPGTFAYFCSVHPKMTGTVIVK